MPTISLEVTEEVLEQLHSMATLNKNETCGVLTGSITTYGVCRINKISPILITNANSKYACIRDAGKANKFINEEFERSNGTRVYLVNGILILRIIQHPQVSTEKQSVKFTRKRGVQ